MTESCENCPQRKVHDMELQRVDERLRDLKERVERLETVIGRGVALLLTNLAAVLASLAQNFTQG